MPTARIEEFAKILVRQVRDAAVRSCDEQVRPAAQSQVATRWKGAGVTPQTGSVMIPDCVDETVFFLLRAVDQELLKISFVASDGEVVDLGQEGLGELAGWYMGSGGWRALYSGERFVDDFSDLSKV